MASSSNLTDNNDKEFVAFYESKVTRINQAAKTVTDMATATALAKELAYITPATRGGSWDEYELLANGIIHVKDMATSGKLDASKRVTIDSVSADIVKYTEVVRKYQFGPFDALTVPFASPVFRDLRVLELKWLENERSGPGGVKGMFICPKCRNDNTTTTSVQTRSADEGASVIHRCRDCGFTKIES